MLEREGAASPQHQRQETVHLGGRALALGTGTEADADSSTRSGGDATTDVACGGRTHTGQLVCCSGLDVPCGQTCLQGEERTLVRPAGDKGQEEGGVRTQILPNLCLSVLQPLEVAAPGLRSSSRCCRWGWAGGGGRPKCEF